MKNDIFFNDFSLFLHRISDLSPRRVTVFGNLVTALFTSFQISKPLSFPQSPI